MTNSTKLTSIWKNLVRNGISIGILMGLAEVSWVYFLPTVFPGRQYVIPVSTVGQHVFIAVVTDIILMLLAVLFLGTLISFFRKRWHRAYLFFCRQIVIRFLLIAGSFFYLYFGILSSYYKYRPSKIFVVGILAAIIFSAVITGCIQLLQHRFSGFKPKRAWFFLVVLLAFITAVNYLRYRPESSAEMDLPFINNNQLPSVLLVTLDTLRADYLACYGNTIVQTPNLDALAADGILFESSFSQSPTTTPSHCSIMTSTYASTNGAVNGCAMKNGFLTLAEILVANGYETAAFVSATTTRSTNSRLHKGFNYYEDSISRYTTLFRNNEWEFVLLSYFFVWLQEYCIPGHIVTERALSWFENNMGNQIFCWLHYFDPHTPRETPPPYDFMYKDKIKEPSLMMYAGEVTYTDYQLGRIIDFLKDKRLYNDMLLIVTSDHGEAFGEIHDNNKIEEYSHGKHLFDTTQHIPLIVKLPKSKLGGTRIKEVVSLIDLAPTVLHYLGAAAPKSFEGTSLLDLINGKKGTHSGITYAEAVGFKGRFRLSMRNSAIKYILSPFSASPQMYDLLADPQEKVNIADIKIELGKSCRDKIHNEIVKPVSNEKKIDFDPRVLENLKSLGYIDDR